MAYSSAPLTTMKVDRTTSTNHLVRSTGECPVGTQEAIARLSLRLPEKLRSEASSGQLEAYSVSVSVSSDFPDFILKILSAAYSRCLTRVLREQHVSEEAEAVPVESEVFWRSASYLS